LLNPITKRSLAGLFLFTCAIVALGYQADKKSLSAIRVEISPKIDGVLDEDVWNQANSSPENYSQLSPNNGEPSKFQTETKIIYTDYGIYIGAIMYDDEPDKIARELGIRDDNRKNADQFGILLDTYNTGINAFAFVVTSAGVQIDMFLSPNREDKNWDAVWDSEVSINENGWVAEIEIPYSAIRFPKQEVHTWGFNVMRQIKSEGEESYWNHVDNSIEGFVNQAGSLEGLEGIKPPVRLFLMPFLANTVTFDSETGNVENSFSAGMDLKYGINESFTLDMSLIPDFSQVVSDNQVLNLSPFEVRFDENRPFFTEGLELFSKGRIFFSRRIGNSFGDIDVGDDEEIIKSPSEASLINSTKISGRTKNGLGIGVLNAITNKTEAVIENTETGEQRTVQVDPLTNFNVLVFDQALKNNSSVGIINTSVIRGDGGDNANVTGMDFRLFDKSNTWSVSGFGAISQNLTKETDDIGGYSNDVGYSYNIEAGKVSGRFQFELERKVASDNYDINDLGFLRRANEISHEINVRYNFFKPVWKLNRITFWSNLNYEELFDPKTFTEWSIDFGMWGQFKNFWNFSMGAGFNPGDSYDNFEPREDGYFYVRPWSRWNNYFLRTDNRKAFRIGAYRGYWRRPDWDQKEDWFGIFPRYRVNNKLTFNYEINVNKSRNERV